eukprot:TRINITY_DN2_c1_g1_i1.p1 TRINITY_DN2_c1_g1~~TRINITY_DN2_c1_g1_i1.p1  ORF type:complete len:430 (+),score=120.59 TRINITY_DN2_c1_g1_i1:408-1697(+)
MFCCRPSQKSSRPSAASAPVGITSPQSLTSNPILPLHDSQFVRADFVVDPNNPPAIMPAAGYRVELGSDLRKKDISVHLERVEENSPTFQNSFVSEAHSNFAGGETDPFIISVQTSKKPSNELMALVRTRKRDIHTTIPYSNNKTRLINNLKELIPEINDIQFREIKNAAMSNDLAHLENRLLYKHYKFGVIYCKEGQQTDDQMFSNSNGSPAFEEFLSLLGERVALKGFAGYDGELDVKTDTTGTHSVFTQVDEYEVMFHVSTLLPFSTVNMQQIERKRHIGNDVVVIIFQDGDKTPFIPSSIASKFNHVYIVVQVVTEEENSGDSRISMDSDMNMNSAPNVTASVRRTRTEGSGSRTRYRVATVSKQGVSPFGPLIPQDPIFTYGPEFRSYLLCKAINAERASYGAPSFSLSRTRRDWMRDITNKYT